MLSKDEFCLLLNWDFYSCTGILNLPSKRKTNCVVISFLFYFQLRDLFLKRTNMFDFNLDMCDFNRTKNWYSNWLADGKIVR